MTDSFADRWAKRFLYALIVLQAVPFFGIPTGLDWPGFRRFNFYKLIVIVLLLGLLSARLDRIRAALQSRTKLIALCAAFAIWVGLFLGSVAYQPGLRSNLEIFLLYWTPSLLIFAFLLLLYPALLRRPLAFSLAGFYLLALTLGYFEWLTWKIPAFDSLFLLFREVAHPHGVGEFLRVGGTLGTMGLAEAILIGLPIVVGFSLEAFKRHRWVVFTLTFVLFPLGLLLLLRTFLRHPLIVALVELLVFILFAFPAKKDRRPLVAGISAILLSLLLGWGVIVLQGHGPMLLARYLAMSRPAQSEQDPTDSRKSDILQEIALQATRGVGDRLAGYEVSWVIMRDWPWTGIGMGPEGFLFYWKSIGPRWWPQQQTIPSTHAHNFYLQMFVSGGLFAGLGFLCLVLLILRKAWQVWRSGRLSGNPQLSPVEIGVLTAVAGVFVSMLFDFKYNLQWSTLILWVLLGTVILNLDSTDGQDPTRAATGEKPAEAAPES